MKSVRCSTIVLAAGCVMALAGGVFIWAFDEILRSQVVKNVQLREGGFTYDIWKDVPVEFHMSVYVWDITNPRQVVRGDKPKLVQRGPFVYREYRKKANITFNENGTVSYREYRHYRFSRERSVASDDFVFTTINVPVLEQVWTFAEHICEVLGEGKSFSLENNVGQSGGMTLLRLRCLEY
ncbi:scavenger receptor class B member 1-like isoform X3 [Lampetra planeri]